MEREITIEDVDAIAIGAGILGTGGGGNTYLGRVRLQHELRRNNGVVRVIDADDVPDDAVVCGEGGMGAPTVGIEKMPNGQETVRTVRALEDHIGQTMHALIIGEIGGSNALRPMTGAFQLGIPVVDGDGMGRAFPELQMDTFSIGGIPSSPMALGDSHGNVVIFDHLESPLRAEEFARRITIEMGGGAELIMPVMSGKQMKDNIIRGTLTLAQRIGALVMRYRLRGRGELAAQAVAELCNGTVIFTGKIVDVERRTTQGFARGRLKLAGFGDDRDVMEIAFQNENLITWHNGETVCTVPDLICILSHDDGEPIGTESLRYGLRVSVLGLPAPKELKTSRALTVVGPTAFGYPDVPFNAMPGDLL